MTAEVVKHEPAARRASDGNAANSQGMMVHVCRGLDSTAVFRSDTSITTSVTKIPKYHVLLMRADMLMKMSTLRSRHAQGAWSITASR